MEDKKPPKECRHCESDLVQPGASVCAKCQRAQSFLKEIQAAPQVVAVAAVAVASIGAVVSVLQAVQAKQSEKAALVAMEKAQAAADSLQSDMTLYEVADSGFSMSGNSAPTPLQFSKKLRDDSESVATAIDSSAWVYTAKSSGLFWFTANFQTNISAKNEPEHSLENRLYKFPIDEAASLTTDDINEYEVAFTSTRQAGNLQSVLALEVGESLMVSTRHLRTKGEKVPQIVSGGVAVVRLKTEK